MNRRDFLKKSGRLFLLGLLGYGIFRSLRAAPDPLRDSRCRGNGVCRGCPRLASCGHPTALSFRETK